jgi:hypothetical protein
MLHQGIAQLTQTRDRLLQSLRIANDNRRLRQPVPTLGLRGGKEVTDDCTRSLNRASVIIDGERRSVWRWRSRGAAVRTARPK